MPPAEADPANADLSMDSWIDKQNLKPKDIGADADYADPSPENAQPAPSITTSGITTDAPDDNDFGDEEVAGVALSSILSAPKGSGEEEGSVNLLAAIQAEGGSVTEGDELDPINRLERLKRLHPQAFPDAIPESQKKRRVQFADEENDPLTMPTGTEEDEGEFAMPSDATLAPSGVGGIPRKFDPWSPDGNFTENEDGMPGKDGFQGIQIPDGMDDEQFVHEFLERQELAAWLNEHCVKAGFGDQKFTAWSNLRYMRGLKRVIMKKYGKDDMVSIGRAGMQSVATTLEQGWKAGSSLVPFNCNELSFRTAAELEEGTYDNALGGVFEEYLTGNSQMDPILKLVFLFGFTMLKNHQREGLNEQERKEKREEMMQAMKEYVAGEFEKLDGDAKKKLIMDTIQSDPQSFIQNDASPVDPNLRTVDIPQQQDQPTQQQAPPQQQVPPQQQAPAPQPAPPGPGNAQEQNSTLHPEEVATMQGYKRLWTRPHKHHMQGGGHTQPPLPQTTGQQQSAQAAYQQEQQEQQQQWEQYQQYQQWQQWQQQQEAQEQDAPPTQYTQDQAAYEEGAGVFPPIPPENQTPPGTPNSVDMPQDPTADPAPNDTPLSDEEAKEQAAIDRAMRQ